MALHMQIHFNLEVCYVGTASYPGRGVVKAVVVGHKGNVISSCSVTTSRPDTEVTVGLVIMGTWARIILSDSKATSCNYARGRVSTAATYIFRTHSEITPRQVHLISTPAHSSLPGNEMSYEAARGCCNQSDIESKEVPLDAGGGGRRKEGIGSGSMKKLNNTIG
ncbi:hypothetical protein HPB48_010392 [Haemaphysalis longicornis]|uniref:Uncharacterized protein n=1 Tax=Haemaphysalis longicornis TaxID=44386 RepID=A0A9J6GDF8_HAELO|nr:hypothetical protein HPB48_010392 [Haemaphysalis longicornis]